MVKSLAPSKCKRAQLQEDTERRAEWKQVLDCTIAVLQEQLALHPQTGLLADFLVYSTAEKRYKPAEGMLPPFLPMIGRSFASSNTLHSHVTGGKISSCF